MGSECADCFITTGCVPKLFLQVQGAREWCSVNMQRTDVPKVIWKGQGGKPKSLRLWGRQCDDHAQRSLRWAKPVGLAQRVERWGRNAAEIQLGRPCWALQAGSRL